MNDILNEHRSTQNYHSITKWTGNCFILLVMTFHVYCSNKDLIIMCSLNGHCSEFATPPHLPLDQKVKCRDWYVMLIYTEYGNKCSIFFMS